MPDAFQVRITPRALSDLEEIFDYIRQSSPQNAAMMIERLMNAIDGLEMFPSRFRTSGRSASAVIPCIPASFARTSCITGLMSRIELCSF